MPGLLKKIGIEKDNIFSILSTTAVSSIVSLVMVLAFANLVDAHVLGTYQYVISIISVIGAFSFGGILSSIIRAIGSKDYAFLAVARKYIYLGSFPALIIGFLIGGYYCFVGNLALGISIILGNILYIHMLAQYRFNSIYTAIGDIKTSNLLIKLYSIAPLIFVFPSLFFIKEGHVLAVIYFSSIWLAFSLGSYYLGMKVKENDLISKFSPSKEVVLEHSKLIWFGFHQSVISLINTASAHIDKIIIFQLLGAQQTAIYFIAISIPTRFRGIVKQFETFIFARFASHSLQAVQKHLIMRFLFTLTLIFPLFILYIVAAPWLFALLLPQYEEAIWLSQIYAITLFTGALIIPQSVLKAHATSQLLYTNAILFAVVKSVLVLAGTIFFGLTGAIIASAISLLLYMLITLIQSLIAKKAL